MTKIIKSEGLLAIQPELAYPNSIRIHTLYVIVLREQQKRIHPPFRYKSLSNHTRTTNESKRSALTRRI